MVCNGLRGQSCSCMRALLLHLVVVLLALLTGPDDVQIVLATMPKHRTRSSDEAKWPPKSTQGKIIAGLTLLYSWSRRRRVLIRWLDHLSVQFGSLDRADYTSDVCAVPLP